VHEKDTSLLVGLTHIFATINQLLSDGCCSNDDNSHQPQGSYLTATLKFSLKYSLPRNCDEHDSPIIDSGANSHSILIYVCTTYYPDYFGRKNQNQNKKEKLLIYILFSKSGLAGQHKYLTPIVSMCFSLSSIYKHHLIFLVICEQHEIDKFVHLPTFSKLMQKGFLTCCSLTARNTYFLKEWSFYCHTGPAHLSL